MKYALKIFSLIIVSIIAIWVILSFIHYSDKSELLRPVTERILQNAIQLEIKEILNKQEIIDLLNKSGCNGVYVIESNIVTALKGTKNEITNHWFDAQCSTDDNRINISITTSTNRFDIRTDLEHTYCFDVFSKKIECYTQTVTALPSR